MSYADKQLTCQDCGTSFTFSADDQQYHAEKGFANEPKRCPSCRSNRRAGGGGGYGGGGGGGRREMHPAVCANCGTSVFLPQLAQTAGCISRRGATGPSTAATASA